MTQKRSIFFSENTGHNYLMDYINCFAKKRCEIFKGENINLLLSSNLNACYHYLFQRIDFFVHLVVSPGLERK